MTTSGTIDHSEDPSALLACSCLGELAKAGAGNDTKTLAVQHRIEASTSAQVDGNFEGFVPAGAKQTRELFEGQLASSLELLGDLLHGLAPKVETNAGGSKPP